MGSVKAAAEVMMMLRVRGLVAVPPHLLLARPVPVVPRRTWWRAGMLAMQVAIHWEVPATSAVYPMVVPSVVVAERPPQPVQPPRRRMKLTVTHGLPIDQSRTSMHISTCRSPIVGPFVRPPAAAAEAASARSLEVRALAAARLGAAWMSWRRS